MGNTKDTKREEINRRLHELRKKIIDNVGNPTIREEVLQHDLPNLQVMVSQCDDLSVDPQKLASHINEYLTNLSLHSSPMIPLSLQQFEEHMRTEKLTSPAHLAPRSTIVTILKKSNTSVNVKDLTDHLRLDEGTVRDYLKQLEQKEIVSVDRGDVVSLKSQSSSRG